MGPCIGTAEFEDDIARRLYALSSGNIGILHRIIERAAIHATKDNNRSSLRAYRKGNR